MLVPTNFKRISGVGLTKKTDGMANKKPESKNSERYRKDTKLAESKDRKKAKKTRGPEYQKQEPKTVESQRRAVENPAAPEQVGLEDQSDAFASFFVEGVPPKVLITTTRRACADTMTFAEELTDLFPLSEFHRREGHHIFKEVVGAAVKKDFSHLVVVNESRKRIDSMSIVKLPEGPTLVFKVTSTKLNKEIHNHGRSSSHYPELILNNFTSRLGHTVGRLFVSLFPHNPEFKGRQVVTFHNQRDFIFVRRHRYIFDDAGKKARLQEIGPQFTLKLHGLYNAACDLKDAPVEWSWKPHAVDNKAFAL